MINVLCKKASTIFACLSVLIFTTAFVKNDKTTECALTDRELFDLAFASYEFVADEKFVLSSDGEMIAYSARQRPENVNLSERNLPNGTPNACVGSKIYVTKLSTKETIEIGPADGNNWRPVWSPILDKLAFYSDAGGKPELWIYDALSKSSQRLSTLPIKAIVFSMDAPCWSPDAKTLYVPTQPEKEISSKKEAENSPKAKILYSLEKKQSREQPLTLLMKEYNSTLQKVDVATGKTTTLVSADTVPNPGFLTISPTGKWLAYLSTPKPTENPHAANADLAAFKACGKGQVKTVAKNLTVGHLDYYIWHPFEDRLFYIQDKKIYSVKFNEQGPQIPQRLCENLQVDFIPEPLSFTQDGKSFIIGAKTYDDSYREKPQSIYVIPLDKGEPIELNLGNYEYLELISTSYNQAWQKDTSSIALCLEEKSTGETHLVKFILDKAKTKKILCKTLARMSAFIPKSTGSDDLLCYYEELNTPLNIYSLKKDFSEKERVSNIDPRVERLTQVTAKVFETVVPLYNGELKNVKTTVLLPHKRTEGPLPAIVLFYPGARVSKVHKKFSGGDIVTVANFVFLNRGYALILPDVILGPEGTPGNPLQETIDVLLPQIYRAVDLGYVDNFRLAIMGQSFGGYGTAGVISKTNLFRAAVAISGLYDLGGNYGYHDKYDAFFNQSWSEQGQMRMGLHPWANPLRYVENSPYYLADKIRTPFLLIHGQEDDSCKVEEAEKLFSALKRLQRDAKLVIFPGGHVIHDWPRPDATEASEHILSFLDTYLKTP